MESIFSLPSWLKENVFYRARLKTESVTYNKYEVIPHTRCHPSDANLISSEKMFGDGHTLMLDLDTMHQYWPSSTPGHAHLVFNTKLSLDAIIEVLTVLNKHGIIQSGVLEATKDRGYVAIRPPGIKKDSIIDNAWFYDAEMNPQEREKTQAARAEAGDW